MKKVFKFISVVLPIIVSIIALVVSFLSYQTSKQSYEYGIHKDMMVHTPAIKENIDSLSISFSLNNENSELQGISITFPDNISSTPLLINTKPVRINKYYLEMLAKNYLSEFIEAKDSTVSVGTFAIPVMIDYSAIVYGFPQELRESRLLVFNLYFDDNVKNVTFSNSFLNGRCGYPLRNHTFYTWIFSSSLDEKIKNQDQKDVQELLKSQLEKIKQNSKRK
ncbi:hypothetical protein [Bacteroides ovatus]|uniref:hypothetical protein n=1 Tax=Bacteroides ovatus TaxID=28116 RepID=UPI001F3F580F|nr:hypothetical protein [Bacteroides ovatus]MCE8921501.1 hypothetical protein [Bacteroides ovatus]